MNTWHHTAISKQKSNIFLAAGLVLLCFITIISDLLFARWQNTSFFISESLLFSTFWLLCFPVLNAQLSMLKVKRPPRTFALMTAASTLIHLFAYPGLVWLLSRSFYDHTFDYWQTFNFGLTEHGIEALLIYSIAFTIGYFFKSRNKEATGINENTTHAAPVHPASILVTDTNNTRISILLSEVLYFSANPPYVNIHHCNRKYLQTGTLKSLETQLQAQAFIRIHKSFLVNMGSTVSYQSRLNGDYDLTLIDGTSLRVSRNYAAAFKNAFDACHQVKPK